MTSRTSKRTDNMLNQIYSNNLNVKTDFIPLPSDLSGAATIFRVIYPFKIRVIGLSLTAVAAPTGGVDIVETITDGTTAILVTLGGALTEIQESEDQVYAADTDLTITNSAGVGNVAEKVVLGITYIIESPQRR
jgi:hypothetical protein